MTDAVVNIALEERQECLAGVLFPTVDADASVTYVGAKDDALRTIAVEPAAEEVRLRDGYGPHRDHRYTCLEGRLDVIIGLDATSEIHDEVCGLGDLAEDSAVDNMPGLRTVEVHDVQAAEALLLELPGNLHRRCAIYCLLGVVAFGQAHTLAVDDVYGGDEEHYWEFKV